MLKRLLSAVAVLASFGLHAVWATDIPIRNGGFEEFVLLSCVPSTGCYTNTVPGWAETGSASTYKPPASVFPNIPDGTNILQLSGTASASQTLAATLQHNTTYTVNFYVGHGSSNFPGYKVEFLAASTVIATNSTLTPPAGTFVPGQIVFQSRLPLRH